MPTGVDNRLAQGWMRYYISLVRIIDLLLPFSVACLRSRASVLRACVACLLPRLRSLVMS